MDNTELIELQNLLMQVVRESKSDVKDLNNRVDNLRNELSNATISHLPKKPSKKVQKIIKSLNIPKRSPELEQKLKTYGNASKDTWV